jgi:hypothetical protein
MDKQQRPPLTREIMQGALGELYDTFEAWDALIECEMDADGWPAGDSNEANMKRLCSEVTWRTSLLIFNLNVRGMEAAPPIPFADLGGD